MEQLADLSLSNLGLTSFAASVRQITFNAWHYADEQLWTGLVEHLFRELATEKGAPSAQPSTRSSAEERQRLRSRVAELRARDEELTRDLASFGAPRLGGLRSPATYRYATTAAIRSFMRDRRDWLWLILAWVVIAASAYLLWLWLGEEVAKSFVWIAGLLTPVAVAARRLQSWHRSGESLAGRVRGYLESRRHEVRAELATEFARLAEVDAAMRLSSFLAERRHSRSYEQYRGLLAQIHRDLQQLDADLHQAHREWEANPSATPPLERIILYIDDLDRCPPQRVVEVLAAVHLMLALPLFIVVTAVDPRWLLGSLQHHYRELFASSAGGDWGQLLCRLGWAHRVVIAPCHVDVRKRAWRPSLAS